METGALPVSGRAFAFWLAGPRALATLDFGRLGAGAELQDTERMTVIKNSALPRNVYILPD